MCAMKGDAPTEYGSKNQSVRFTLENGYETCMTLRSRISCQWINQTDSFWGVGTPTCCRSALKTPSMSLPREPLDAPSPW